MNFLQVLIVAILQGVTEFLPVSSEGHLAIVEYLLKMDMNKEMILAVMLHLGTLVTTIIVFRNDVKNLVLELMYVLADIGHNVKTLLHNKRRNDVRRYLKVLRNNNRKFAVMIIVSLIPTAIIGILLRPMVEKSQGSLLATGAGLLITAVFLLVVNFTKQGDRKPLDIDYKIALLIGIVQGFSVLPGISRAGVTIAICLLCGCTCKVAIKYSFILSIPTILGATIVTLATTPNGSLTGLEILYCMGGIIITAIVGLVCVKVALKIIKKNRLKYFAGYSLIIGIIAIAYHFA